MFETRAQAMRVKPKVLIARTRKELAFLKNKIDRLSGPWADIDNSVEGAKAELMAAFERFENHVKSAEEYLNDQIGR